MKLSKRELILVVTTALIMCIPMAIIANRHQKAELPSGVFDWKTLTVVKTASGERRQVFDNPTRTLNNLECHITTLNPGQAAHAPHQHKEEEMMLVKEGTVEALVNGQLKQVGPGSVIFQASNDFHGIKNTGTTQATYFVVKFASAKSVEK